MSKRLIVTFGCGYGRHTDEYELTGDEDEAEIASIAEEMANEKFDFGWRVEEDDK